MTRSELAHLELLAEVDALTARLRRWADGAPTWQPAETCQALVRRLQERTQSLRVRLESPLVVATLGGTGTGKSSLVNALLGDDLSRAGRQRPTTQRPVLIAKPDITPEMLGIDPALVELVERDLPILANLVLIDCPDPDTTEEPETGETNLIRLRQILPHCDVLLVTATQQKYRSARVNDELRSAARGARLIFVQTHAQSDEDIRPDWARILEQQQYSTGHIFLVDSLQAAAEVRAGRTPEGEFGRLRELLTRQLVGTAGNRIRRANFLDLVADTLQLCRARIETGRPALDAMRKAIDEQRARLGSRLARDMRAELLASQRQWESRLLGQVASRWGFSPFALVLRVTHGLGGAVARALLFRVRTPAQLALWGALEGARTWQQRRQAGEAEQSVADTAARCWEEGELRAAALVLDGYASEAELDRRHASMETVLAESRTAGGGFVGEVATELDALIGRQADQHTGRLTRWGYEAALGVVLGLLVYRLGRNFFWDSWLADAARPLFGMEYYLAAAFWLLLWCLLLLWAFTRRLRRGLRRAIDELAQRWAGPGPASALFTHLEDDCRRVEEFDRELAAHQQHVAGLRRRLALPEEELGYRR